MKTILISFIFSLLVAGCTNDDKNKIFKLPPETQIGANTFGVTIKGKVYIPRDPSGTSVWPNGHGMILWRPSDFSWYELDIVDGASAVGFQIRIHMQPLASVGQIILHQSNFQNQIDSTPFTHIYFKIWDSAISNYAYYGSIEDQGELNITRLDSGILSGNFKGKFVRYDNPNDFIEITDGRFDIDTYTLSTHPFP